MEPAAIIGMGCRFPGATGLDAYWKLLSDGRCAIREVPAERWDADALYDPDPTAPFKMVTRWGGFLDDVDKFDPAFWRILPREAQRMDPQHRQLLEVTWEALEDAGLSRERLAGTKTGVFLGLSAYDYGRMQSLGAGDPYACYCCAFSIAANRISYLFDWCGPSLTLDTACSSSLVALHLALESLRRGESTTAIVAGVNLILHPDLIISLSKAGMMAPDGLCKPFDARANGYVRSEGIGVVVLKPAPAAERDRDRIYALVHGSAVNQDGRTNGLTAPNPRAQERVLREAYADAGIDPIDVGYVEAHGTGTALGDSIEAKALGAVFGAGRALERPLVIGSVKSNIGHTEPAAGVASIIKTALALQRRIIPSTLHHETPNPGIDFERLRLRVATHSSAWPDGARYAGVSGFGYGGTNAHVVLGPPSAQRAPRPARAVPELLLLSARAAEELSELAGRTADVALGGERPFTDLCATAALRRTHFEQRLAVVADDATQARDALRAWSAEQQRSGVAVGRAGRSASSPVFVCCGNGGDWWGMARALVAGEPVFRDALTACDAALRAAEGWSILEELARDESECRFERPLVVQPVVAAIQIALGRWWEHVGVRPAAVVGHSMGEVAAAHLAGALSLGDALRVIGARARHLDAVLGRGRMLAVDLDAEAALELVAEFPGHVELAVENAPGSCVLSGDGEALQRIAQRLEAAGSWSRFVRVAVPYHSAAVDPVLAGLARDLRGIDASTPSIPLLSTVEPLADPAPRMDAAYWVRNARERVRFAGAVRRLIGSGHELFIELGPHPIHSESITRTLRALGKQGRVLASVRRGDDSRRTLLSSLGELWVRGVALNLEGVMAPDASVVPLPGYPFRKQRYWFDPDFAAGASASDGHPVFPNRVDPADAPGRRYSSGQVTASAGNLFAEHRLHGVPVLPGTAFVDGVLAALAREQGGIGLTDLAFVRPIVLADDAPTELQLRVDTGDGSAVLFARAPGETSFREHATARLADTAESPPDLPIRDIEARLGAARAGSELYAALGARGYEYGSSFKGVREFRAADGEALAALLAQDGVLRDAPRYAVHPALLDASIQLVAATVPDGSFVRQLLVPLRIQRVECWQRGAVPRWAHVVRTALDDRGVTADIVLADDSARAVVALRGLRVELLSGSEILRPEWFVGTRWIDVPAPEPAASGTWAVLGDAPDAERLCAGLEQAGVRAVRWRRAPEAMPADLEAVVLAALDAPETDRDAAELELELARSAFDVAQKLVAGAVPARLFAVTRATQQVESDEPARAFGASVWGIGRTLAFEHPELRLTCIDAGEGAEHGLVRTLLGAGDEDQIAVRVGPHGQVRRFAARLTRAALPRRRSAPDLARCTVVVTGGLGALGLRAAASLVAEGARSLALWGRSAPSAAALERIRALEASGVRVLVQSVDVADGAAVAAAIARIEQVQAPVRGVLHCAGVVDNGLFAELDAARLETVFRPKVHGALNLWQALRSRDPVLFVLYGSVAGFVGSPGQTNYAAANAWLESFARTLHRQGVPASCIAWGAWSEIGLAAAEERWFARVEAAGLMPISPAQGDAALLRLLRGAPPVVGVVPFDTGRLRAVLGARPPSLFRDLLQTSDAPAADTRLTDALRALAPSERPQRIAAELTKVVATMLGVDASGIDARAPLGDLGLDSLLLLELRTRVESAFGGRVPASALMRQPTIDGVATALASALDAPSTAASEPVGASHVARSPWIHRKRAAPTAAARLYCFCHAGGTQALFNRWSDRLAPELEVCGIQLPGRERRSDEPFATDLDATVGEIAAAIRADADRPYALFGHSLGALLAFECARALRTRGAAAPVHLFLSSLRAPHLPRKLSPASGLPDDALVERLREYRGLPAELLEAPDLLRLLLPRIRADMALLDDYVFSAGAPLACPITALGGDDDTTIPAADLDAWRSHTSAAFTRVEFGGGHFYLEPNLDAVLALFVRALGGARAA